MLIDIEIEGKGMAVAELDQRNPEIAQEIYRSLPLEGVASIWGEEVYFEIPLVTGDENPSPEAVSGDLSYWSPGSALCIFFGKTQPYSPVNHLGKVVQGLDIFWHVKVGDRLKLSKNK